MKYKMNIEWMHFKTTLTIKSRKNYFFLMEEAEGVFEPVVMSRKKDDQTILSS